MDGPVREVYTHLGRECRGNRILFGIYTDYSSEESDGSAESDQVCVAHLSAESTDESVEDFGLVIYHSPAAENVADFSTAPTAHGLAHMDDAAVLVGIVDGYPNPVNMEVDQGRPGLHPDVGSWHSWTKRSRLSPRSRLSAN